MKRGNNGLSNNSMDVRAKQQLCLERRPLPLTLTLAVSPHVISTVRRFLLKKPNGKIALLKTKTLRVKSNLRESRRRAEDGNTPNKSMNVRAKQRLCYQTFS